jgi:hypothetical protein
MAGTQLFRGFTRVLGDAPSAVRAAIAPLRRYPLAQPQRDPELLPNHGELVDDPPGRLRQILRPERNQAGRIEVRQFGQPRTAVAGGERIHQDVRRTVRGIR